MENSLAKRIVNARHRYSSRVYVKVISSVSQSSKFRQTQTKRCWKQRNGWRDFIDYTIFVID